MERGYFEEGMTGGKIVRDYLKGEKSIPTTITGSLTTETPVNQLRTYTNRFGNNAIQQIVWENEIMAECLALKKENPIVDVLSKAETEHFFVSYNNHGQIYFTAKSDLASIWHKDVLDALKELQIGSLSSSIEKCLSEGSVIIFDLTLKSGPGKGNSVVQVLFDGEELKINTIEPAGSRYRRLVCALRAEMLLKNPLIAINSILTRNQIDEILQP